MEGFGLVPSLAFSLMGSHPSARVNKVPIWKGIDSLNRADAENLGMISPAGVAVWNWKRNPWRGGTRGLCVSTITRDSHHGRQVALGLAQPHRAIWT